MNRIPDALAVAGAASVTIGAGMIFMPAGFIVAGAFLIAGAVIVAMR